MVTGTQDVGRAVQAVKAAPAKPSWASIVKKPIVPEVASVSPPEQLLPPLPQQQQYQEPEADEQHHKPPQHQHNEGSGLRAGQSPPLIDVGISRGFGGPQAPLPLAAAGLFLLLSLALCVS